MTGSLSPIESVDDRTTIDHCTNSDNCLNNGTYAIFHSGEVQFGPLHQNERNQCTGKKQIRKKPSGLQDFDAENKAIHSPTLTKRPKILAVQSDGRIQNTEYYHKSTILSIHDTSDTPHRLTNTTEFSILPAVDHDLNLPENSAPELSKRFEPRPLRPTILRSERLSVSERRMSFVASA